MRTQDKTRTALPEKAGLDKKVGRRGAAFTLLELLVVIGVIAILAGMALPAFKGFGESNILEGARRQLMDDLSLARQKAISERTTVYMLFIPPFEVGVDPTEIALWGGQYTSYALYAKRSVGDQPGQEHPRFLTEWRSLPDGMVISPVKFQNDSLKSLVNITNRALPRFDGVVLRALYTVPPRGRNDSFRVNENIRFGYLAFNSRGQMGYHDAFGNFVVGRDEMLTFEKGSVFLEKSADTGLYNINVAADLMTEPNGVTNYIRVNSITGRPTLLKPEI